MLILHLRKSVVTFLFGLIFLLMGCDPAATTCNDQYETLGISSYCSPPRLMNITNFELSGNDSREILRDVCATDYTNSYTFKVPTTGISNLSLHQYLNFPGEVAIEVFGSNCKDTTFLLMSSCQPSSKVVNVYEVEINRRYTTAYVRVIYSGKEGYVPGQNENVDNIALAAYSGRPELEEFQRIKNNDVEVNKDEIVYLNCDGSATNRLILSGRYARETAIASGLPYEKCECSNDSLFTVTSPPGVDLNTLKPKVREKPAEPDTTNTSLDLIIAVSNLNPKSDIQPDSDPLIVNNKKLEFATPLTQSSTSNDVVVTIVDSGIDLQKHEDVFKINQSQTDRADCQNYGPYGTDLIDRDEIPDDEIGHGTAVASAVISGYDRERPLTVINNKFLDQQGGSLFNGLCGGYAGIAAKSHIINLSWGFHSQAEPKALKTFLDYAEQENTVIVVSAGNDSLFLSDTTYWPASYGGMYPNMITVASYAQEKPTTRAWWSNYGKDQTQIAAIYARQCLKMGGETWYPSGTSISAPIVTGYLAALKADHFGDTAPDLVSRLLSIQFSQMDPNFNNVTKDGKYLGYIKP